MFRSGRAAHDAQCRAHLKEGATRAPLWPWGVPNLVADVLIAGLANSAKGASNATAKGAAVLAGFANPANETSTATAEGLALARGHGV